MTDLNAIRLAEGSLPQFSSVGGYTVLYLTRTNQVLCADCATPRVGRCDDPVATYTVFDEGAPEDCDDCGRSIESSYGDPDA